MAEVAAASAATGEPGSAVQFGGGGTREAVGKPGVMADEAEAVGTPEAVCGPAVQTLEELLRGTATVVV